MAQDGAQPQGLKDTFRRWFGFIAPMKRFNSGNVSIVLAPCPWHVQDRTQDLSGLSHWSSKAPWGLVKLPGHVNPWELGAAGAEHPKRHLFLAVAGLHHDHMVRWSHHTASSMPAPLYLWSFGETEAPRGAEFISLSLPKHKAADQVYCPSRADRKEAYKINKYPYTPMYSPCAPWTDLTAHMQKHFEAQIRAITCSKLLCQEGSGTSKAGHSQNHHLCSFPTDASIPLAWSSQLWCPASAAHPMATVLGHRVPRLFSIQSSAQFMPLPVWPRSLSWEHQDIRLCPGGTWWPRGMEANRHMLGCQLVLMSL